MKELVLEISCPMGIIREVGARGLPLARYLECIEVKDNTRDEALARLRALAAQRYPERQIRETWGAQSSDVLRAVLEVIEGDGHTIFKPEAFLDAGVPDSLVAEHTRRYTSNPDDPKLTIFDADGKAIPALLGVYGLTVLWAIQADIGAEGSSKSGRGFLARQLTANILAKLDAMGPVGREVAQA